jgi:hypothetical protein
MVFSELACFVSRNQVPEELFPVISQIAPQLSGMLISLLMPRLSQWLSGRKLLGLWRGNGGLIDPAPAFAVPKRGGPEPEITPYRWGHPDEER